MLCSRKYRHDKLSSDISLTFRLALPSTLRSFEKWMTDRSGRKKNLIKAERHVESGKNKDPVKFADESRKEKRENRESMDATRLHKYYRSSGFDLNGLVSAGWHDEGSSRARL